MHSKPAGCPASSFDPFDESFLRDPYPQHHALRELGPIVWIEPYDIVALSRYEQVRNALADYETFCSGRGGGLTDFATEEPWRPPSIILEADPPLHTRTRGVLGKVLSRPALSYLREEFAVKAAELVDSVVVHGDIDGIEGLAEAFPLSVFPDAIGLKDDGRENLLPYGDMAFNAFGPKNALFEKSFDNAKSVIGWITEQCQRDSLAPDGIGSKVYAAVYEGAVNEDEAALLVRSLLTAGLDTTIFGIGAALYCFASFPDQWQLVRNNPKLVKAAFDEAILYVSPVQTFFRTTSRSVEIDGIKLPEGQKVLLFLASANRDPRRWDNPDVFDVSRQVRGHVGFGYGIHLCVGQMLAKLEAEVLIEALAARVSTIELTGKPEWRLNNTLHGLDRLPIRVGASA